jgi:hypothetical protein
MPLGILSGLTRSLSGALSGRGGGLFSSGPKVRVNANSNAPNQQVNFGSVQLGDGNKVEFEPTNQPSQTASAGATASNPIGPTPGYPLGYTPPQYVTRSPEFDEPATLPAPSAGSGSGLLLIAAAAAAVILI